MSRRTRGITLLELLVSLVLLSIITIGLSSIDLFGRFHVISSDRRAQVQNALSYVLEEMSKDVIRAKGDFGNPGIVPAGTGFSVRIDNNTPPVIYALSGSQITKDGASLNSRDVIVPGPTPGFAYGILDNGVGIEIRLIGRYQPSQDASMDNPEIQMKTRVYSHSASAH